MDNEEEKKEDKGEHINLKVKDQVRAAAGCFFSPPPFLLPLLLCFPRFVLRARSFEREREKILFFFFKTRGAIFFFLARTSLLSPSL